MLKINAPIVLEVILDKNHPLNAILLYMFSISVANHCCSMQLHNALESQSLACMIEFELWSPALAVCFSILVYIHLLLFKLILGYKSGDLP